MLQGTAVAAISRIAPTSPHSARQDRELADCRRRVGVPERVDRDHLQHVLAEAELRRDERRAAPREGAAVELAAEGGPRLAGRELELGPALVGLLRSLGDGGVGRGGLDAEGAGGGGGVAG